jgi:hypothetical protein
MMIIDFIFKNWKGLLITILASLACKTCAGDYIEGSDEEKIAQYETMIKENTKTIAVYDSVYTKHTVKVAKLPMTTYSIKYKYEVNGVKYGGEQRGLIDPPNTPVVEVYYLKDNPSVNKIDPASSLKYEKEKETSNTDLYFAIFWGVLALLLAIGLWVEFRDFKKEYKI